MYLALDTGKRNGWAQFAADGTLLRRGVLLEDDFLTWLTMPSLRDNIKTVICENFRLYPHMGDRLILNSLVAVRMIGAVQLACKINDWELFLQEAQGMKQTVGHLGYKYGNKTHIPDHLSAHAHGYMRLNKNGILGLEKARKDKEEYEARDKGSAPT